MSLEGAVRELSQLSSANWVPHSLLICFDLASDSAVSIKGTAQLPHLQLALDRVAAIVTKTEEKMNAPLTNQMVRKLICSLNGAYVLGNAIL